MKRLAAQNLDFIHRKTLKLFANNHEHIKYIKKHMSLFLNRRHFIRRTYPLYFLIFYFLFIYQVFQISPVIALFFPAALDFLFAILQPFFRAGFNSSTPLYWLCNELFYAMS